MSLIYFKDYRKIGFESLEDKYEFGDFMVTNEEVREGNNYYRKNTFIHKVELTDSNVESCFLNVAENKYSYEDCKGKCAKSDLDGSITPERVVLPQAFQDFCNKEEDLLEQTIVSFFDKALWIYKSSSLLLRDPGYHWFYFSFNLKDWHLVPFLPMGSRITFQNQHEYEKLEKELEIKNRRLARHLLESMNKRQEAPVYPRIYFEVIGNISDNPETAIVLAVESVEVALKTCIAHLDDKTKWLMDNVPSPPLEKILKEYLPLLVFPNAPAIPNELINNSLKKAVCARNRIVHLGSYKADKEKIEKWLTDLGRIIAYLECYMGCEWADCFFDRPFNHWFFC